MKVRLNLTIDEDLLINAKEFAHRKQISLSKMVEDYLKTMTKRKEKKNIIQLVDELKKPDLPAHID